MKTIIISALAAVLVFYAGMKYGARGRIEKIYLSNYWINADVKTTVNGMPVTLRAMAASGYGKSYLYTYEDSATKYSIDFIYDQGYNELKITTIPNEKIQVYLKPIRRRALIAFDSSLPKQKQ